MHAINLQGAKIARHAARDQAYVAGAIGPLGIRIEPWGKTGVDEAEEYLPRAGARRSLEGGVDLFVLETFRDVNEIGAAIRAVRSVCDLPIVAQMTTEEDGNSLDGAAPGAVRAGARSARRRRRRPELQRRAGGDARDARADGARRARCKLSAQPNAGRPREIEGRNIYLCSPEYMASYARRFINNGVRLVGGCCGTTPEHIRQIKRRGSRQPRQPRCARAVDPIAADAAPAAPVGCGRDGRTSRGWRNALARGGVRRQRRAAAAARLSRPTRCSSRRGSCASAASTW